MQSKHTIESNLLNIVFILRDDTLNNNDKYQRVEKLILEDKNLINRENPLLGTCLHIAVKYKQVEIVLLLLREGADINTVDSNNETALHYAAKLGLEEMVFLLSYYKASATIPNNNQETALHFAAKKGHLNCIKILLTMNASLDQLLLNQKGETAEQLIMKGSSKQSERNLRKVFTADYHSLCRTALHNAVLHNLPKTVTQLLAAGEQVNAMDSNQATPLHYAARYGFATVMSLLCQHPEISMNHADRWGDTALHLSAKYKHREIINILVTAIKPVNRGFRNNRNETAEDIILKIEDKDVQQALKDAFYTLPVRRMSQEYKTGLFSTPKKPISDKNLTEYVQDNLKSIKINTPEFFSEQGLVQSHSSSHLPLSKKNKSTKEKRESIKKEFTFSETEFILKQYEQEKIYIDSKIKEEETKLQESLLIYGLEHSYPFSEVKPLLEDDFKILSKTNEKRFNDSCSREKKTSSSTLTVKSDCLQAVYSLCKGKNDDKELKTDMDAIYKSTIGLLVYYKPYEIVTALIKLSKHFSNHQNLIGQIVVKNIILLSFEFEYNLSETIFNKLFSHYLKNNCLSSISNILGEIKDISVQFQASLIYKNLIKNALHNRSPDMINISERINQIVTNKSFDINDEAKFIAFELNNITASFYQKCPIDNYNKGNDETNKKSYLQVQLELFNALTSFIEYHILIQPSAKHRARAITLFALTAQECLNYPFGPELNSMVALFAALDSINISRLKESFALLDKSIVLLIDSIKKISNPIGNFKFYRNFSNVYSENLPYLGFILRENTLIPESKSSCATIEFLGQLYAPLINLRTRLQFCTMQNKSDLFFQLMEPHKITNDEAAKMSFFAEPVIPILASSKKTCTMSDFSYCFKKFKLYDFPLTVFYKNKIFEGEKALDKIYSWLDHMKENEKINEQTFQQTYSECQDYVFSKHVDAPLENQSDLINKEKRFSKEKIPNLNDKANSSEIISTMDPFTLNTSTRPQTAARRSNPSPRQHENERVRSHRYSRLFFFAGNDNNMDITETIVEKSEEEKEHKMTK